MRLRTTGKYVKIAKSNTKLLCNCCTCDCCYKLTKHTRMRKGGCMQVDYGLKGENNETKEAMPP